MATTSRSGARGELWGAPRIRHQPERIEQIPQNAGVGLSCTRALQLAAVEPPRHVAAFLACSLTMPSKFLNPQSASPSCFNSIMGQVAAFSICKALQHDRWQLRAPNLGNLSRPLTECPQTMLPHSCPQCHNCLYHTVQDKTTMCPNLSATGPLRRGRFSSTQGLQLPAPHRNSVRPKIPKICSQLQQLGNSATTVSLGHARTRSGRAFRSPVNLSALDKIA